MKRCIAISGVLLILVSLPATAQQAEGNLRRGQIEPARPLPAQQQAPAREANRQNREAPHDARMSPEARRQLRRDIHDHGREIYHQRASLGKR